MSRRAEPDTASLRVRVLPRAAHDAVGPLIDGVLQVRVARPPVDGEANLAIRRLLARALRLPPSHLHLAAGERSRAKRFVVEGLTGEQLAERLKLLEHAR